MPGFEFFSAEANLLTFKKFSCPHDQVAPMMPSLDAGFTLMSPVAHKSDVANPQSMASKAVTVGYPNDGVVLALRNATRVIEEVPALIDEVIKQ